MRVVTALVLASTVAQWSRAREEATPDQDALLLRSQARRSNDGILDYASLGKRQEAIPASNCIGDTIGTVCGDCSPRPGTIARRLTTASDNVSESERPSTAVRSQLLGENVSDSDRPSTTARRQLDRGKIVATASRDKTIKIWSFAGGTPEELATLTGHTAAVMGIAFSLDGMKLGTCGFDNTARIWDVSGDDTAAWRHLRALSGHTKPVRSISFSPDGTKVATASYDMTGKIWDIRSDIPGTWKLLVTLEGHTERLFGISWAPDGTKIATGSHDKTAKIWNVTGHEIKSLEDHDGYVYSVAFSPDSSKLGTASWDATSIIWNVAGDDPDTWKKLATLRGHNASVRSIAWSPDGSKIGTVSWDSLAIIYDVTDLQPELEPPAVALARYDGPWLYDVSWSADGRMLGTACDDATAQLWNVEDISNLTYTDELFNEETTIKTHQKAVFGIAFSPAVSATGAAAEPEGSCCDACEQMELEAPQIEVLAAMSSADFATGIPHVFVCLGFLAGCMATLSLLRYSRGVGSWRDTQGKVLLISYAA